MTSSEIQVAVAVILNHNNEVLISLRSESAHQGGLWEFPGGKIEDGETVLNALRRELKEELSINVLSSRPFKSITHHYADKTVVLNVQIVDSFSGQPRGAEGQKIQWKSIRQLNPADFPSANRSIIHALNFPDRYMITGSFNDQSDFLYRLQSSLIQGIKFVQLRCKHLNNNEYIEYSNLAYDLCDQYAALLFLNTTPEIFNRTCAHGLHLSSHLLYSIDVRPINTEKLLSVSCHTIDDICQAKKIDADIILLSPVKETTSHPDVEGIGWERFSDMINSVDIPVYALGGMSEDDIVDAKEYMAQGIAAISSFWK